MIYEWQAVGLTALGGGFLSTFLPHGMDTPSPPVIQRFLEAHSKTAVAYHVIRNSIFGFVAGVLVWLGENPHATLGSADISALQIITSFAVGGGGLAIVNGYFSRAQAERAGDNLAEALDRALPVADNEVKESEDGPRDNNTRRR